MYKLFILQSVRDLILEVLLHEDSWLKSWSPPEEGWDHGSSTLLRQQGASSKRWLVSALVPKGEREFWKDLLALFTSVFDTHCRTWFLNLPLPPLPFHTYY